MKADQQLFEAYTERERWEPRYEDLFNSQEKLRRESATWGVGV